MRPTEISLFLRSVIPDEKARSIFIWGPPGIGKSAIVNQAAQEVGIGFVDLRLAIMDPTDLRGIPVPKDGKAVWLPPAVLPSSGEGILFLDELTLAPQLVQSSAYQLVLDKRLGEYVLPKGWRIMAAGNRSEHGASVFKMAFPLRNRFIHIEFEVNVDDWRSWAIKNGIETEIIEFISFRPDILFNFDPKRTENAFASPRSWEFASDLFRMKDKMPKNILFEAIEGTVGKGSAAEFFGYLDIRKNLPSIEEILAGKNFVPEQIDVAYAVVTALVVHAKVGQFGRLIEYANYLPAEVGALLAKLLLSRNKNAVLRLPEWKEFALRHADLISD